MSKYPIIDLDSKTRCICFDPGDNTGWIWLERKTINDKWDIIEGGTFDEHDLIQIEAILNQDFKDTETLVLFEQMQVFSRHISTKGLEVTGAIRFRCAQLNLKANPRDPSYLQGPRKWPLHIEDPRWKARHIYDALIHVIVVLGHSNITGVKIGIL